MKLTRKKRRAAILTLFVFLLPVLLILLGFSVDMAYMQLVQTEMRLAADNTARVAADDLSRYEDECSAKGVAVKVAKEFTVAGKPLKIKEDSVSFGRATPDYQGAYIFDPQGYPPNAVQINAARNAKHVDGPVPLFFGKLIGQGMFSPTVTSTASFINVDICLVLDRSTSMKFDVKSKERGMKITDPRFCKKPSGSSRWAALESGVKVFTKVLRGNTSDEQVSIITYGSDLDLVKKGLCGRVPAATNDQVLTNNLDAIDESIKELSDEVWNGNTEIASGIDLAVQELNSERARRFADRVMIVLTDGYPTAGDAIAAAQIAAENRINVYAITFGDEADQNYMKLVAAAGNGEHMHADDEDSLKDVFRRFAAKATILIQ
jgi:Ca-activated chloride channel homolog